ncbi:MAG: hypothetical protein HY689_03695 [Chloroflexi bacterium]|nr:hypothetical protein [Chloroflexota bacterium]
MDHSPGGSGMAGAAQPIGRRLRRTAVAFIRPRGSRVPAFLLRVFLALVLAVTGLGAFPPAPAGATHTCPAGSLPVHFTPPEDPALRIWEVEGKIAVFDTTARTMTANGLTFTIPSGLRIKTLDLDQPEGNLSFGEVLPSDPADPTSPPLIDLVDPALEAVRTVIGGTAIADGRAEFTTTVDGTCMSLSAESVFVELAENGIIGLLMSVDVADGSFVVDGATVRMNDDPRFPSDLLDLGGDPITLEQLVGNEGGLVDVGGYFEAGELRGTAVQAEILQRLADRDTVAIERAQGREDRGELRVVGLVSPHPVTGQLAASVDLYDGTKNGPTNAESTGCNGVLIGDNVEVDPVDGAFVFRERGIDIPDTVCVVSPGGGVDDRPVDIDAGTSDSDPTPVPTLQASGAGIADLVGTLIDAGTVIGDFHYAFSATGNSSAATGNLTLDLSPVADFVVTQVDRIFLETDGATLSGLGFLHVRNQPTVLSVRFRAHFQANHPGGVGDTFAIGFYDAATGEQYGELGGPVIAGANTLLPREP